MPTFSRQQVLGMAPDAASVRAGEGLAVGARWRGLGRDEQAVWGECRGSGAGFYDCGAALDDGATRCSCPSSKIPCKHALGLLLLLADGAAPAASRPDWVTGWLDARSARQARRAARISASAPGDGPK